MLDCVLEMKEKIEKFLAKNESFSLRWLSLKSGNPYTSLWNIQQGKGQVSFGLAVSVLTLITDKSETAEFLERYFPDKAKAASNIYSNLHESIPIDKFREHLNKFIPNQVFTLAATRSGTTEEKIRAIYGGKGIEALEALLASEMLLKDERGNVRFPGENFAINNPDDALSDFSFKIEGFDKSQLGTPGGLLWCLTESVNEKALIELKEIFADAYTRASKIVLDSTSEGPIPLFAGLAMNVLDKDSLANKDKK
jgi:hypothetical protein